MAKLLLSDHRTSRTINPDTVRIRVLLVAIGLICGLSMPGTQASAQNAAKRAACISNTRELHFGHAPNDS